MIYICRKCNEKTDRFNRCDNCYKCDMCGTRDELCSYLKGVYCLSCHKKSSLIMIENFQEKQIATDYTDDIVCPGCGHNLTDSWELADEGEHQCGECDTEFIYSRDVSVTYSSELK